MLNLLWLFIVSNSPVFYIAFLACALPVHIKASHFRYPYTLINYILSSWLASAMVSPSMARGKMSCCYMDNCQSLGDVYNGISADKFSTVQLETSYSYTGVHWVYKWIQVHQMKWKAWEEWLIRARSPVWHFTDLRRALKLLSLMNRLRTSVVRTKRNSRLGLNMRLSTSHILAVCVRPLPA